jgi:molecular chaperone HscB
MNYFELFGLPTQFELDGSLLSSQFLDLQKRFHPDNFALAQERERLQSVQKAAEINDAYQTLKAPLSRAEYLLAIHGVDIRGEQQTMQDPTFLLVQMELREELEAIESMQDAEQALFDFDDRVSKEYQAELHSLAVLLSQQHWLDAATAVRKLKFIAKLKNEIARVEEKLLD